MWAVGDVTGVMPFTHVGMYQARIVCADIAGNPARADYSAIPRVVFSDPEITAVGRTEAQARKQKIDFATSRVDLADSIARPWTYEKNPCGALGLLADRERQVLIGAWAVAPLGALFRTGGAASAGPVYQRSAPNPIRRSCCSIG